VIRYDKPNPWEKDDYRIEGKYKGMIKDLLNDLKTGKRMVMHESQKKASVRTLHTLKLLCPILFTKE